MTAELTEVQALASGALPLRQDDPISMALIIKTMLVLALLLLVVYLALRWYARRGLIAPTVAPASELRCVRELRLSPRTRAYLLDAQGQRLLLTESASGVTVTPLGSSANQPGAAP
ncbi:hypothetical protein AAFN46_20245 [Pseudomonas sp. CAU 1711]|uniref:hypothetical protein n=1 Tax=Pseudomonas sp. CAU 1711 TaxID=3140356 RepID=UPI003260EE9F